MAIVNGLAQLTCTARWLRIVCGVRIVLGKSGKKPADSERLQIRLQAVSNLLGIDLLIFHIEREGFQIFFLLRPVLDRRLRPLVEWIIFDAVLFCCGNVLGKRIKLTLRRGVVRGEDVEELGQRRVIHLSPYRFRRCRIVYIESDLILPLRGHAITPFGLTDQPAFRS